MLQRFIDRVLGRTAVRSAASFERLSSAQWPALAYAIGDVHGCYRQLLALHDLITQDAADVEGEKWIVMLGDYVDRGPDSASVLDTLIAPAPKGFRRICLAGNHEAMMRDFLSSPDIGAEWLRWGGTETLMSYGISVDKVRAPSVLRAMLDSHIPTEHVEFLSRLPVSLTIPGVLFVHAGLRPGVPIAQQELDDLLWIREPFLSAPGDKGLVVVHGHTPDTEPVVLEGRIGIDTGAYRGGPLTAVCLQEASPPRFLSVPHD